jgi:hypothetical protein
VLSGWEQSGSILVANCGVWTLEQQQERDPIYRVLLQDRPIRRSIGLSTREKLSFDQSCGCAEKEIDLAKTHLICEDPVDPLLVKGS